MSVSTQSNRQNITCHNTLAFGGVFTYRSGVGGVTGADSSYSGSSSMAGMAHAFREYKEIAG